MRTFGGAAKHSLPIIRADAVQSALSERTHHGRGWNFAKEDDRIAPKENIRVFSLVLVFCF
jgi:hypothetical protein